MTFTAPLTRIVRRFAASRSPANTVRKRPPHQAQLLLESLEGRNLLSPFNISQNPKGEQSDEGTIAVNPTHTDNLFAGYNSSLTGAGFRYSTDAGVSWHDSNYTPPWGAIGDVQATFDKFGNLFVVYLTTDVNLAIAESINSGQTFPFSSRVLITADQPSVATGPGGQFAFGQAVVSWYDVDTGLIFARAAAVNGFQDVDDFGPLVGVPGSSGNFGSVAVAPDGTIMVNWQTTTNPGGPSTVYWSTAPALISLPFRNPLSVTDSNVGSNYSLGNPSPLYNDPRGIDVEADLKWDRSNGPHNGRVYMSYVDAPAVSSPNTVIYLRYSDDAGLNWSGRKTVSDDSPGGIHFNPQIAVDQTTGNVAVAWYATNDASGLTVELFASVSLDGGDTWKPQQVLSTGPSDAHAAQDNNNFGDYNTMDAHAGFFYPIWADNSGELMPASVNYPKFDMAGLKVPFSMFDRGAPASSRIPGDQMPAEATLLEYATNYKYSDDSLTGRVAMLLLEQHTAIDPMPRADLPISVVALPSEEADGGRLAGHVITRRSEGLPAQSSWSVPTLNDQIAFDLSL